MEMNVEVRLAKQEDMDRLKILHNKVDEAITIMPEVAEWGEAKELESFSVIKRIEDGSSGDDKYILQKDNKKYLLRIGDICKKNEKQNEYNKLLAYIDTEIVTHRPILFGTTENHFYSVVTWVEGTPVMDIIKSDTLKSYYELGKTVGKELRKLHDNSLVQSEVTWRDVMGEKYHRMIENFHRLKIDFSCSKQAEEYIVNNLALLKHRPEVMLHGDFHWNNCVVDDSGTVGIIDFSGNQIGDPWYEFGGIVWALEYSESFANGQIDGYFNDSVPNEFWSVLKLYFALYAFEHFMFSNGTPEDIQFRISNATRMLNYFGDHYQLDIPVFRE